ncbi:NAD(P)-binding protein [Myriangium duriaei CBS 260.36]|uniref:Probable quinone oxidoreductase n=1 Tax=Myriangium duriaei CBS 260.36 TaxID=1168546 RepID=A0A9P4J992_9PEZI|nr:NAD(P)-binding protein [Myriangium duriaei CBS 260.36]
MASLPSTMKGVVINKTGGTEVLEYKKDLQVPKPKENQVLVRNSFVGINYIDTYFRTGLYPAPNFPYMLGRDAEGVVVSIPSGTNAHGLKEGDRVVYLSEGTYAEYTAAPAAKVVKIPEGIPEKVASAALLQGLTALTLIKETYNVQKGDWVLVHAAAGGVGLLLCQLLRAVGAKTIATASTEEKRKLAKENGAEVTIGYDEEEVKQTVKQYTNGEGVKAVFDGVGKATFDLDLDVLARKGTLASFGNASGAVPPLTIARLSAKNLKVARPTLFNYITTEEEFETYTKQLWDFILKGELNIKIHEVYPLTEVAKAHTDIEGRKTTGKLLLDPTK